MRTRLWTFVTICLLALPLGAVHSDSTRADSLQDGTAEAERLAGEAVSKLLRALNLLIDSVPQYAAPEMLPNGDIILRRLHPENEKDAPVETNADDGVET